MPSIVLPEYMSLFLSTPYNNRLCLLHTRESRSWVKREESTAAGGRGGGGGRHWSAGVQSRVKTFLPGFGNGYPKCCATVQFWSGQRLSRTFWGWFSELSMNVLPNSVQFNSRGVEGCVKQDRKSTQPQFTIFGCAPSPMNPASVRRSALSPRPSVRQLCDTRLANVTRRAVRWGEVWCRKELTYISEVSDCSDAKFAKVDRGGKVG